MEDSQLEFGEWSEDVCKICGAHVGYGIPEFHLERCDDHANDEDDG